MVTDSLPIFEWTAQVYAYKNNTNQTSPSLNKKQKHINKNTFAIDIY